MANRIRQLREEHCLSQVRLSIELGVSQETISAYENEKHYPTFLQLCNMSKILNASIDYIMCLSDVRTPVKLTDNESLSKLIAAGKELSPEQIDLVLAYIKMIADTTKK